MDDIHVQHWFYSNFAAWVAKIDNVRASILFGPYLDICFGSASPTTAQEAGSDSYECIARKLDADIIETIEFLVNVEKDWRNILSDEYICGGGTDEDGGTDENGGFAACVYHPNDFPFGECLRWASEIHYKCACAHALVDTSFPLIHRLSLNSGSRLSRDAAAVRTLAQTGSCEFLKPDDTKNIFECHVGFKTNLDDPRLNAAASRAIIARFSQDARSQAVLLATGDAKLISKSGTLIVGLMAARAILRVNERDPAQALERLKLVADAA